MAESVNKQYTGLSDNLSSNVKFLSGLQSDLNDYLLSSTNNTKKGKAIEGAFYLTTDTHRLYIGRAITDNNTNYVIPIPVNEGILSVASISNLPANANQGEFYYIEDANILAVRSGNGWAQINSNTDRDTKVNSLAFANGENAYQYTLTLTQEQKDLLNVNATGTTSTVTGTLNLNSTSLKNDLKVGVQSSAVSGGSTTVSLNGGVADSTKTVTVSQGDGITLSGSANNISIAAKPYTLVRDTTNASAPVVKLQMGNQDVSGSAITFTGDGGNISIDTATAGTIKVKHNGAGTAGTTYGDNGSGTAAVRSFKVPKIAIDANGHVKTLGEKTITVPNDAITSISANSSGQITLSNNVSSGQDLYYNMQIVDATSGTSDASARAYYNQATLPALWTGAKVQEELNNLSKNLNAMTYMGNLPADTKQFPNSGVKVGDTYTAPADGTYTVVVPGGTNNSISGVKAGDIFIASCAQGTTEEADGTIAAGNIYWNRIASGDIDTTYTVGLETSNSDVNIKFTPSTNPNSPQIATLSGGTNINVGVNNDKVVISHATSGVTAAAYGETLTGNAKTLSSQGEIKVPKITVDAQGHITVAATNTYTLPASNNDAYTLLGDTVSSQAVLKLRKNGSADAGDVVKFISGDSGTTGLDTITYNSSTKAYTFKHKAPGAASATAGQATSGNSFTYVSGVTTDAAGHVTGYTTKQHTLAAAAEYSLTPSAITNNSYNVSLMVGNSNSPGVITYTSETLTFAKTDNGADAHNATYNIELKWGSF